jgi:hypothetical protein
MVSVKNSALKDILKSRGVKNYSSANKEALLKMVEASGGMPSAAPAPAPEAVPEPAPKSPKKTKKVKVTEVDVACNDVEVVSEEPVKKVKKVKKDKSPSPEKKPAAKKAKKAELKVEV